MVLAPHLSPPPPAYQLAEPESTPSLSLSYSFFSVWMQTDVAKYDDGAMCVAFFQS